jgi:hypothetical protein
MLKKNFAFLLVLITSIWIWKMLLENFIIAIVCIACTILIYQITVHKVKNNKLSKLYIFLLVVLALLQIFTTQYKSLTKLDDDGIRVQQIRLNEYPPTHITIAGKTLWLKFANWFEQRDETRAFFRMESNVFQSIDPSLYFFVNHPRERFGVHEFEKFPYILMPFFIIGIVSMFYKYRLISSISFIVPVFISAMWGNNNPLSNFTFFPLIAISITHGLQNIYKYINLKKHKSLFYIFCILFTLVFLQTVIYTFK